MPREGSFPYRTAMGPPSCLTLPSPGEEEEGWDEGQRRTQAHLQKSEVRTLPPRHMHLSPLASTFFTNQKPLAGGGGRTGLTYSSALRNLVFPQSREGPGSHRERKQKFANRKYDGIGIR